MTDLKEYSDDILAIDYRASWFDRILNLAAGVTLLAPAIFTLLPGTDLTPVKGYEAFAAPFLVTVEIFLLTGAFFFLRF